MKRKSANLKPEWDIIFPRLIAIWRKMRKLPLGPEDRLQTREFQHLIQDLLEYKESKDLTEKEGIYLRHVHCTALPLVSICECTDDDGENE